MFVILIVSLADLVISNQALVVCNEHANRITKSCEIFVLYLLQSFHYIMASSGFTLLERNGKPRQTRPPRKLNPGNPIRVLSIFFFLCPL
jgi:hypothetical protein